MIKTTDTLAKSGANYPDLKEILMIINPFFKILDVPLAGYVFSHCTTIKTAARISRMEADEFIKFLSLKIGESAGCIIGCKPAIVNKVLKGDDEVFFGAPENQLDELFKKVTSESPELSAEFDVSDLPAPEPLFKIMEYIDKNPAPVILRVRHRQKPMHLPPVLLKKNYLVSVYKKADHIKIYIFSKRIWEKNFEQ